MENWFTLCTEHGTTLNRFGATPSCVQTLTRIRSVGAPLVTWALFIT